jgi:formylglycine-generating enzyme required for sulfatase activity
MTTIADGLEKLKQLRDAGDLTPEEYAAAKAMLLSRPADSGVPGARRTWVWAVPVALGVLAFGMSRMSSLPEVGSEAVEIAASSVADGDPGLPDVGTPGDGLSTVPQEATWASATLGTFRLIPAGTFTMGCKPGRDDVAGGCDPRESPAHSVTLTRPYYLMEHEVTQGEWQAVMGSNPSYFTSCGSRCPVEQVSWHDVQAFIAALSERGGLSYRLPTEAEWEWAARGGQEFAYAGSSEVGAVAWYGDNSDSQIHPVCGKSRNGYGLCDMSGNVFEWVGDWYDDYGSASATDPRGPSAGSRRLYRGGSGNDDARSARVANREGFDPAVRVNRLGFRLLRSVP